MIVITLTKVPKSLKGDLTKWYQEIQTGVYVGNVSARIRDALWERIMKNIGHGEATMVYNASNELGYQFRTTRRDRDVVDFDGIPLMMHLKQASGPIKHGFSNAAKFHKAKVMSHKATQTAKKSPSVVPEPVVAIDLETTGLDPTKDEIMSIGAVKLSKDGKTTPFYRLIQVEGRISKAITELTNITPEILTEQGSRLTSGLQELKDFIGDLTVIGYNLHFDEIFLTNAFRKNKQADLTNEMVDLMPVVKEANEFLDNYQLKTVLVEYEIENGNPHNALADAEATLVLAEKLIENKVLKI